MGDIILIGTLAALGAGVMVSAAFFSLILPGIEAAASLHGSRTGAALIAGAGIALGAAAVAGLNEALPHEHFVSGPEGTDSRQIARIWLFVLAITIHNFPEGLAVGVGFGGGNLENGLSLATGIGLQNAPEGLAVAAGAMLYIVSHEIIPETHRHGHQDAATAGLVVGLILMMVLDVSLS